MKQSNHTHRDRAEAPGNRLRPPWAFQAHSRDDTELDHLLTTWADDIRAEASKATLPTRASLLNSIKQREAKRSDNLVLRWIVRRKSSE